jgi:hypothetical protein
MECPVCHELFDYLLGSDANGGRLGCEADWRPSQKPSKNIPTAYNSSEEII